MGDVPFSRGACGIKAPGQARGLGDGPVPMSAVRLALTRRKLATIHDLEELRGFREGLAKQGVLAEPILSEIRARMTALYAAQTGKGVRRG